MPMIPETGVDTLAVRTDKLLRHSSQRGLDDKATPTGLLNDKFTLSVSGTLVGVRTIDQNSEGSCDEPILACV